MAGPATGFLNPDALLGDLLLPVVSLSVAVILFEGGLNLLTEEGGVLELAFEATSAFGTVGLSTGYTPRLSGFGKGIIIVTMLVGRIGPLGLAFALAEQPAKGKYAYPMERPLIG